MGHIHQQKSTLYIKDSKELKRNADKYQWGQKKMDSVFDDGSKTWATVTNKLYAQTASCLILQDVVNPGKVSSASDGNDMRPTEVLVEVIWGVPLPRRDRGSPKCGDEISTRRRRRGRVGSMAWRLTKGNLRLISTLVDLHKWYVNGYCRIFI